MLSKKNKVAVKIYYELDDNINDTMDYKPQAVPALKRIAGLCQARVAYHRVYGSNT